MNAERMGPAPESSPSSAPSLAGKLSLEGQRELAGLMGRAQEMRSGQAGAHASDIIPEERAPAGARMRESAQRATQKLTRGIGTAAGRFFKRGAETKAAGATATSDVVPAAPAPAEATGVAPIESENELLDRLLTELQVLKEQYYEGIPPRQAAIELAKKLGLGGSTDKERIARMRYAYNQVFDHASDEALDRFDEEVGRRKLDERLWLPIEEILSKGPQEAVGVAAAPATVLPDVAVPASATEAAQPTPAAPEPAPSPYPREFPLFPEEPTPAEWEPDEAEAGKFLLRIPEVVEKVNEVGQQLKTTGFPSTRANAVHEVALRMHISSGSYVEEIIDEFIGCYTKAAAKAPLKDDEMREALRVRGLLPAWLDWVSPYITYKDSLESEVFYYEAADPESGYKLWEEGMGDKPALFVEPVEAEPQVPKEPTAEEKPSHVLRPGEASGAVDEERQKFRGLNLIIDLINTIFGDDAGDLDQPLFYRALSQYVPDIRTRADLEATIKAYTQDMSPEKLREYTEYFANRGLRIMPFS